MTRSTDEPLLLPCPRRVQRFPVLCEVDPSAVTTRIDPSIHRPQGYRLSVMPQRIEITGQNAAALFYGQATLDQIVAQYGKTLPCLNIFDSPDFPVRGVMLDVSRDKVPSMATLKALIDMLSSWKINQLQLYIEHTFAYRNHRDVWKDASPFTAEEIRELDAYCRARFVDLVPNQNSFGHMERWLKHPKYLPLAEAPDGAQTPWGSFWEGPFSLCPTDPRSIELLDELYAELLPNFSSGLFNVGCDETFDIGQGRSAAQCKQRGTTQVYLDFLRQVHELVKKHDRKMMFWGDIIKAHPELIHELIGAIGLVWGYEADSPFDQECAAFARADVPFYICPGTSTWCSIAGRTDNMVANAKSAATNGLAHGAAGYLMTDWGDHGHLQYLPISYAGFAAGAAFSWCLESNADLPLPKLLDAHAFGDSAGVMGKLACDLGNVYKSTGKLIKNGSSVFRILVPPPTPKSAAAGMTADNLIAANAAVDAAMAPLPQARMENHDADLMLAEFRNAAAMLKFACNVGLRELNLENLAEAPSLQSIMDEHQRLWLARNRPGGLDDSIGRLKRLSMQSALQPWTEGPVFDSNPAVSAVGPGLPATAEVGGDLIAPPETILIAQASVESIRPLRHLILRAGLPPEAAMFDGDDEPTTLHAAAIDRIGRVVGCATIVQRPYNGEPGWQLRGMAIDADLRGHGIGRRLLSHLEQSVRDRPHSRLLWCNARTPAVGFYAAMGWASVGNEFHIETAGPHYRMFKRLPT